MPARRLIRNDSHSLPYVATNSTAAAAAPGSAAGTKHTGHDVHTLPDDVSVRTFSDASTNFSIPPVTTTGSSTLSNMATTSTDQIASHHYNNNKEGLLYHAGAEFDRMHFQQLAQGFDPLISSWVQMREVS